MTLRTLIAVLLVAALAGCSQRKAAVAPPTIPATRTAPTLTLPDGDPLLGPTTARPARP
jgi:hypothetical protein